MICRKKNYITNFSVIMTFVMIMASILLIGCLDVPSDPKFSPQIERISVYTENQNNIDSTTLKIHPDDTTEITVNVYPRQYKDELTYEWYNQSKYLGKGKSYSIPPQSDPDSIPNVLYATDNQGNKFHVQFTLVVNTPPSINKKTIPANGDTLYGDANTAFLFKWQVQHKSSSNDDIVTNTLVIDTTIYDLGTLTSIYQSGFEEGMHSFFVVAKDTYGDVDTLNGRIFYVRNPYGAKK